MATTLAGINSLVNDRRRDTSSNTIDMTGNGFRAVNSTLNIWNQVHEWEFQIEKSFINFNKGVTVYSLPSGYKAPIDIGYYKKSKNLEFAMTSESNFDSETLKSRRFAIQTRGQTEKLRLEASGGTTTIDPASQLSENGTWVGATACSNVATDSYEYFDLGASVSFDYSGTSGTMTKTLTSGVDLSQYYGRSSIYWNVDSSVWTSWTSMTLKIGTDASNYYTASVTSDYLSEAPTSGQWSKFKIAWSSLSTVGTPTITNIAYIQLTIAFSVNPASVMRIENFFISEDVPMLFEYYSTNMVQAASGGAKTQIFSNAANTTDTPLWTGKWDFVTEAFVSSILEIVFWMTGEYTDFSVAQKKVQEIAENARVKFPSRRRYPEMQLKIEIN